MARLPRLRRRDVVAGREDGGLVELGERHAAQRVELGDRLDLVAEELDADGAVLLVGREDLDGVAAHAEGAAVEVDVVALVLDVDERPDEAVAQELLPLLDLLEQPVVRLGGAEAVDAGDRRHDEHVVRG